MPASSVPPELVVGARCECLSGDRSVARRGVVSFVGTVHFAPGVWVGITLDEPMGKNDGAVKGKRYFTCTAKYGTFVQPVRQKSGLLRRCAHAPRARPL